MKLFEEGRVRFTSVPLNLSLIKDEILSREMLVIVFFLIIGANLSKLKLDGIVKLNRANIIDIFINTRNSGRFAPFFLGF